MDEDTDSRCDLEFRRVVDGDDDDDDDLDDDDQELVAVALVVVPKHDTGEVMEERTMHKTAVRKATLDRDGRFNMVTQGAKMCVPQSQLPSTTKDCSLTSAPTFVGHLFISLSGSPLSHTHMDTLIDQKMILLRSIYVVLISISTLSVVASAFLPSRGAVLTSKTTTTATTTVCKMSSSTAAFVDALSQAVSQALNRDVKLQSSTGGGYAGGGGASTSAVMDPETNTKYFVKSAFGEYDMLKAEYHGVKEMDDTHTIRVPKPIAYGKTDNGRAFVVFEYLEFTRGGSGYDLGVQLAKMHRSVSTNGAFGFHLDNTIGATPQPNGWETDWADFWDKHRLGHMLRLTDNAGYSDQEIDQLRQKTRTLLSSHKPVASLLHGDLWGGNKGYAKVDGKTVPVIFDPATYYGDREADIAMTYLFGGFGNDFYNGYESEWPLPEVSVVCVCVCVCMSYVVHCVCGWFSCRGTISGERFTTFTTFSTTRFSLEEAISVKHGA